MLMTDIAAYVRDPDHRALMTGTFHWEPVGVAEMRDGEFQLYVKNPETGIREMRYRFGFDGPGRRAAHVRGREVDEAARPRQHLDAVDDAVQPPRARGRHRPRGAAS